MVAVQRALGHASATTTLNTYGHLWPDADIAAPEPLLQPYRVQFEAAWAGREPNTRRLRNTRTGVQPKLLDLDMVAATLSCSRVTVHEHIA